MRETKYEKQWHWHLLYISTGNWYFTRKPLIDIRKNSFDFLWFGFQITWRYYGNARDSITGIRLKDQYKTSVTSGSVGDKKDV